MTFMDDIKNKSEKYGAKTGSDGSSFYQFKEGLNRIKILAQPEVIAFHFFGQGQKPAVCIGVDEGCPYHTEEYQKPTLKLATYILDRDDGDKIKIAELPLSISYSLNDLQQDVDFQFDDFPMPYDVKVTHDPDNSDPKAKYRMQPAPDKEELSEDVQLELDKKMKEMTPADYVEARKRKQVENTSKSSEETSNTEEAESSEEQSEIDPNNISF